MPTVAEKPKTRPPRDGLIRARLGGLELRSTEGAEMPTLRGHLAVFNEWTEINSRFEGRFRERIAPGAFKKNFAESGKDIKVLFQHGHDPVIGDKPLGPLTDLREDEKGAYYESPLLDTSYNRDLLPGLEAGLYGASFRFRVVKDTVEDQPERSEANPEGIPERTITEAQVFEGGPVTFPAYAGATAEVRSLTDELFLEDLARNPESLRRALDYLRQFEEARALSTDDLPSSKKDEDKPAATPEPSTPKQEPDESTPRGGSRIPLESHEEDSQWRLP